MVQKRFTKTATILFYVNPSIEIRIKKSKTIDLMEGGKEQAQNVPNSKINPCDMEGNEGHADGSSRDVPIQSDSEGAKKQTLMFARTGRRAQQTAAATKMIKLMMMKKRKGKVEKWSLQVEKCPHLRASSLLVPVLVVVIGTYTVQQIPWAPHQIPWTPLPRVPRQISSFYSTLG
jgi:hypothetical protein